MCIAGNQARALIDTGANSCFVSDSFYAKALLSYCRSKHAAATLANNSSAMILGKTNPVTLNLQSCSAPAVFQVLAELDGVDVVVGLNFLREHNIQVISKDLAIFIPMPDGSLLVKAAPQQPAFSEFSADHVEVVSGARLARLVAHEDGEVFIGYVDELNPGADTPESTAATQPATFAAYEADLVREIGHVVREDVTPGLPPERTLPDGRTIEHAIPLKPDANPVAQQPYKLTSIELDEVQKKTSSSSAYQIRLDATIFVAMGLPCIVLTQEIRYISYVCRLSRSQPRHREVCLPDAIDGRVA